MKKLNPMKEGTAKSNEQAGAAEGNEAEIVHDSSNAAHLENPTPALSLDEIATLITMHTCVSINHLTRHSNIRYAAKEVLEKVVQNLTEKI